MVHAQEVAQWHGPTDVWLDHITLGAGDADWLAPVTALTLWAVKVPDGLLAALPSLVFLDLRGGSGTAPSPAAGCTSLRYLQLNQVRGVADLTFVQGLTALEVLSLYGLPRVARLPSLADLSALRRVDLGSMKGLEGLTGLHDAPALEELTLIRAVSVADDDARRLAEHPTLRAFEWYGEDVPVRLWQPFRDEVGKPRPHPQPARDWFARNGGL